MKHIHIILEDEELKKLEAVKGDKTWKDLLMKVIENE